MIERYRVQYRLLLSRRCHPWRSPLAGHSPRHLLPVPACESTETAIPWRDEPASALGSLQTRHLAGLDKMPACDRGIEMPRRKIDHVQFDDAVRVAGPVDVAQSSAQTSMLPARHDAGFDRVATGVAAGHPPVAAALDSDLHRSGQALERTTGGHDAALVLLPEVVVFQ